MIEGMEEGKSKDVDQLLAIGLHCTDAELYQEDGHWNVKEDRTAGALPTLAAKRGMYKEKYTELETAGEFRLILLWANQVLFVMKEIWRNSMLCHV